MADLGYSEPEPDQMQTNAATPDQSITGTSDWDNLLSMSSSVITVVQIRPDI